MPKEYRFNCWECGGHYTTQDKEMPLCRSCQSRHAGKLPHLKPKELRTNIIHLYGKPSATALQQAKWDRTKEATRLIKKSDKQTLKEK